MAIYTNLAVDCSDNVSVAESLFAIYDNLELNTRDFGTVGCDVEHIKPHRHWGHPGKFNQHAGDWHTLCVSPTGIENGSLISESLVDELRPQLYEPLKQGFQFRSALFWYEAQDDLLDWGWLKFLEKLNAGFVSNMPGIIVSKDLITNPDAIPSLKPFCDGYLWYEPS